MLPHQKYFRVFNRVSGDCAGPVSAGIADRPGTARGDGGDYTAATEESLSARAPLPTDTSPEILTLGDNDDDNGDGGVAFGLSSLGMVDVSMLERIDEEATGGSMSHRHGLSTVVSGDLNDMDDEDSASADMNDTVAAIGRDSARSLAGLSHTGTPWCHVGDSLC